MGLRRGLVIVLSVAGTMAFAFGFYVLRNHESPRGQEPLTELNAQTLHSFKDRFNHASSQQRIILLLSPT